MNETHASLALRIANDIMRTTKRMDRIERNKRVTRKTADEYERLARQVEDWIQELYDEYIVGGGSYEFGNAINYMQYELP